MIIDCSVFVWVVLGYVVVSVFLVLLLVLWFSCVVS